MRKKRLPGMRAADEAVLDQTLIRVDQATYDLFIKVLDQKPSGAGFDRLMRASKPFAP